MPAPLVILAAWVGQQLLSEAEAEGWRRIKTLIAGDPQVKEIAEALKRAIDETADIAAKDGAATGLREGIFNAFTQYQLHGASAAHDTVLGELRASIDQTLRESGLTSLVPNETMTQLEFLAPAISLEVLVDGITRIFVSNIKKMATAADSPLHNLSQQLNADEHSESLKRINDKTLSIERKVDAVLEVNRHLMEGGAQKHTQAAAIYDTLKLIHADYLLAFAEAEKMLKSGVSSADLVYFLETRRATLAVERIEAVARADLALNDSSGFGVFAQAVSDYFDTANGPTRITYFTGLLTYMRDLRQIAQSKQWAGNVRFDFSMTADGGETLLNAIASARVDIQRRFENIARAYVALDS